MPARGAKPPNPVSVGFIVTLFVIEGFSEVSQDERNWIGMIFGLVCSLEWKEMAPLVRTSGLLDDMVGWIQSRS